MVVTRKVIGHKGIVFPGFVGHYRDANKYRYMKAADVLEKDISGDFT